MSIMTTGAQFHNLFKIVRGNAAPQTALADGSFPASGSFIDLAGCENLYIVIALGALADALTFTVQESTAVNGSLTSVTDGAYVATATDDGKTIVINVPVQYFTKRYATVTVSGVAGNNYAAIQHFVSTNVLPQATDANVLTLTVS